MPETGKYIYGVIAGYYDKDFDRGVYTLPYQDISAVVSDSEIVDYTNLRKDVAARFLIRHQQTIEKIMGNFTIIPMRLGTFAADEGEVKDILRKAYALAKDIIEKISDKIELDVVATWADMSSILRELGDEKEIKECKEKLLADPGGITVDGRMKVGAMVKKALDKKTEQCASLIHNALRNVSEDVRMHELMDEKMITNTAFLIETVKQKKFDRILEDLNAKFEEKLKFRCVGPLPPYSFYTLEVKKIQFEDLNWARKKLGLSEDFATHNEIRKAHQAKAFISHPDQNPDKSGIEKEFDEITRAYTMLSDYCEAFEGENHQDICSFTEEDFKRNAILVRVRE